MTLPRTLLGAAQCTNQMSRPARHRSDICSMKVATCTPSTRRLLDGVRLTGRSAHRCRERILKTNFWAGEDGRPWKHSVASLGLDVLCVSQFTLYGELKRKKGRGNLDWRHAMGPEPAKAFYEAFLSDLRGELPESSKLADGRFGAMMDVALVNDGPVTLSLDSRDGNGLAPVVPPSDDATV